MDGWRGPLTYLNYLSVTSSTKGPMGSKNPENLNPTGLVSDKQATVKASDSERASRSWEVEQKYIVQDADQLQRRLQDAGYVLVGTEEHEDIYFRHPVRDFRQTDEALRLRKLNDRLLITYKGQRLEAVVKTRPEIELSLRAEECGSWEQLLQCLGFAEVERVRKQRSIFKATASGDELSLRIIISLDRVQGLGDFAEIELIVADAGRLHEAQSAIELQASALQLTQVQPRSYLSQLLAKKGRT